MTYKKTHRARRVTIREGVLVQDMQHPLKSKTRVWIEADTKNLEWE
jgi:hypothetical protein